MPSEPQSRYALDYGVFRRILEGEDPEPVVVQILGYKQIPGGNNRRFRLLLNDGVDIFPYALLATHLNDFIFNNLLEKYTIFRLKKYQHNQLLANKKVIICLDIEIIIPGHNVNQQITQVIPEASTRVLNSPKRNAPLPKLSVVNTHCSSNFGAFPSTSHHEISVSQNWDITQSGAIFPSSRNKENAYFCYISCLSPYQNKWTVKARVSYKTHIMIFSKTQSQGKYFAFHLLDESGEIRAVAFNQDVDKYYDLLELFKIYTISNACVKSAHENSPVKFDFELVVDHRTKIEPLAEDASIPMPAFKFQVIRQISSLPKGSNVDIIGVCYRISDITCVPIKSGNKEMSKRTLSLIDKSKLSITATLWGVLAENFPETDNPIVAIKNAKVSNYGGCSLIVNSMSMLYIDPDIHKTSELRSWFQTVGFSLMQTVSSNNLEQTPSQNWKTVSQVMSLTSETINSPFYYTTKATITRVIKETCMYRACSNPECCFKKVVDLNNGRYKCNKCNQESTSFNWSYLLSLQVADSSGSMWAVAFKEVAESLIGMSANELNQIKNEDEDKFFDILNGLNLRTYIFKMRSVLEIYNEDMRLKTYILSFSPVETLYYTKKLLNEIKRISRMLNNS